MMVRVRVSEWRYTCDHINHTPSYIQKLSCWWNGREGEGYGEGSVPSDPICLQETSPNQSPTKLAALSVAHLDIP